MQFFIMMPFADSFTPVLEVIKLAAVAALPQSPLAPIWLRDVHSAGKITDDILVGLNEAAFCVADVTGHNPNVMWETGYAMALGKPTILIGQDIRSLPFDLITHRVHEYSALDPGAFRRRLTEAIRQTLARYELKGTGGPALAVVDPHHRLTITVTGSSIADEAPLRRRIEVALHPYLSPGNSGSFGRSETPTSPPLGSSSNTANASSGSDTIASTVIPN